ncbi:MAG: TatD family deoxyribonuclease [Betaproteobacteria bacterium]|nr:TatD family deoxyribonuclease [Betaproteobacteria bacterium]
MLIDTHCHLDAAEFTGDRDAVHAAALAGGVGGFVVPAVAVDGFAGTKSTVERYAGCCAAYGIHPLYSDRAQPADLAAVRDWLVRENPVAVGEIGLDGFVDGLDPARQEWFFVEQLKLAAELDLPVILHVRRAVDTVLKHLRRIRVRGGIAHAFNGSRQQADAFIGLGFRLGFGGAMTFTGSTRIRALAATLPLESIVLETDAPDIPPAWLQGARNTPGELPRIAAVFGELRGIDAAAVAMATTASACAALPGVAARMAAV